MSTDQKRPAKREFSEDERLRFYRCLTRIFQTERAYGGDAIDAIILRAVAIGRIEQRPMNISSLADYLGLPRQTVSRRVNRLAARDLIATEKRGNETVVVTTPKATKHSLPFVNEAIGHTIEFVRSLDPDRSK